VAMPPSAKRQRLFLEEPFADFVDFFKIVESGQVIVKMVRQEKVKS
jgi:hypothetical protein